MDKKQNLKQELGISYWFFLCADINNIMIRNTRGGSLRAAILSSAIILTAGLWTLVSVILTV